jgi:gamma-glutamyl:cysteine ligase YbdK (ATP-grasp superfamily)
VALQSTQRGATDEAVEKNDELIASQNRLKTAWTDLMATIAEQARPGQIAINDMLAKLLDGTALNAFKDGWSSFLSQLATQSNSAWTAFLAGTQTAADGFKTICRMRLQP